MVDTARSPFPGFIFLQSGRLPFPLSYFGTVDSPSQPLDSSVAITLNLSASLQFPSRQHRPHVHCPAAPQSSDRFAVAPAPRNCLVSEARPIFLLLPSHPWYQTVEQPACSERLSVCLSGLSAAHPQKTPPVGLSIRPRYLLVYARPAQLPPKLRYPRYPRPRGLSFVTGPTSPAQAQPR